MSGALEARDERASVKRPRFRKACPRPVRRAPVGSRHWKAANERHWPSSAVGRLAPADLPSHRRKNRPRIMKLSVGEHCATHLRDPGCWLRDRRARSGGRLLARAMLPTRSSTRRNFAPSTVAMRMASRGVKPASTRSFTAFVRRESWYAESGTRIRSEHEAPTSLDELQRERPLTSRRRTWLADQRPHVEIGLTRCGMLLIS